MIQVTESFKAELYRIGQSEAPIRAVRVARNAAGGLGLVPDAPDADDVVLLSTSSAPELIASRTLAAELDGAILHFRDANDRQYGAGGVALLQPRTGIPRPVWSPPEKAPSPRRLGWLNPGQVSRRREAPASTTQGASL